MKKIILSIALFIGVLSQVSIAQDKTVALAFNKSLTEYYGLKNALATDKPAVAQQMALNLQTSVKAVPHKGFATAAQHELWMEQSALMQQKLKELAAETDLETQRKSFRGLSDAFVKVATELKINDKKAFVQYCPMGKYTWLNEVKEVQNPFYGSKMYDCGELKATISRK